MKTGKIPGMDLDAQDQPAKKAIQKAVLDVIKKKDFIHSKVAVEFEVAFAKWVGRKEVVGCNSGTAALFLALEAMGIGPGDEVITTPFTFIATTEAIIYAGAKPVLVDIDPRTFCIDPKAVERAITSKTKAILPVHLYGHPADMDALGTLAQKAGLKILEDAAQSHGAVWSGRKVGSFGDAAAFSFFPGKNLGAYGDAGGVATDDPNIVKKLKMLRNHGSHVKYVHEVEGYNERLDGIQAAVLFAKLPFLDGWIKQRQAIAARYDKKLNIASVRRQGITTPFVHPNAKHAYHLYVIRAKDRPRIQKILTENGIATAIHYPTPLHLQPCYSYLGYKKGDFPEAELASQEVLSLPLFPGMKSVQIEKVIRTILNIK